MEKKNEPIICECTKCKKERWKYLLKNKRINHQLSIFKYWEMKEK